MMEAVGRPRGLIRYASENGIAEGKKLRYTGRMKFYTLILILLTGLLSFMLISRKDVDGTIIRAAGITYQERGTDSISNLYNIKIINKTTQPLTLILKLEDAPGHIIEAEGRPIEVKAEGQGKGSFFIVLPNDFLRDRKTNLKVGLYAEGKKLTTLSTNFMGPFKRKQP
jgi:polyferredoxin